MIEDAPTPGVGPAPALLRELDSIREDADALAGGLSPRQLWWRPAEGRWSVGECLDHLVRTGEAYIEVLDEAIEDGWAAGSTGEPPFRRTLLGRWLERHLAPPPGWSIPAPDVARPRRPTPGRTPARTPGDGPVDPPSVEEAPEGGSPLPRLVALRDRLARRLDSAEGLDFGRVKVRSPFVPLLRVDLESVFHVIAAHERRHLWQARKVTEEQGFPEG